MMISAIEWKNGCVRLLDQTRLPEDVVFVDCKDYRAVGRAIRDLQIRGAPAIGIAAAMGVALGALAIQATTHKDFFRCLEEICLHLASTRPTAVNLFWAIERMKRCARAHEHESLNTIKEALGNEARQIAQEDVARNRAIGQHGAAFIEDGHRVLTYCNTGGLATGGHGTALGTIKTAWEQGKKIEVIACETRPVLQGARLTLWELIQEKIPALLITDNMAGHFMKNGKIDLCVVGADRIAANGDVANKIGTYTLAVLAKEHRIPFYVAAPTSTIDFSLASGEDIPIEERSPLEVTHIMGKFPIAPKDTVAASPAFDVTPASYISAIITERGAFRPGDLRRLKE